jgi:hypothetical protein
MHPEGSQLGATQGARVGEERAADVCMASPSAWDDDENESARRGFKRLSALEAQALRDQDPPVSPWRVVATQVAVGFVVACLAGAVMGSVSVFWSALYGAGVVVVPAVLMARGMTSRLSSANAGVSAVSFMLWEFVKIGVSSRWFGLRCCWPCWCASRCIGWRSCGAAESRNRLNVRRVESNSRWQLKVKPPPLASTSSITWRTCRTRSPRGRSTCRCSTTTPCSSRSCWAS